MNSILRSFLISAIVVLLAAVAPFALADGLSIHIVGSHHRSDVAGSSPTSVDFMGWVTNKSDAPITFELSGFANPSDFYLDSLIFGVQFPGVTLGAGESTGPIDLLLVNVKLFDPSLPYPGLEKISLTAINPNTGATYAEKDLSVRIVRSVSEPSSLTLLLLSLIGAAVLAISRNRKLVSVKIR
jgi:hypothetical protein